MHPAKPSKVGAGPLERAGGVGREMTRNGRMKPKGLELLSIQPRVRPMLAGECLDLASAEAALLRPSLEGQQPLIAQVDNMLARRSEDRRGVAGSNEVTLGHDDMLPRKHKKHKTRANGDV